VTGRMCCGSSGTGAAAYTGEIRASLALVSSVPTQRGITGSAAIDVRGLSIGADIFVYTVEETARLEKNSLWFQSIMREIVWLGEES
jgi:hypothetical protein